MILLPKKDPVEFLIQRKYPKNNHTYIPHMSSRAVSDNKQSKEIISYRTKLKAMPRDELFELYIEEQGKNDQELKEYAEREDQKKFFNHPSAIADFEHWCKATYWTLDEAIALSFGKAPEKVNWKSLDSRKSIPPSPFIEKYQRVRDLALRAKSFNQLYDPVLPGIFLAWARRNDIGVPPELVKQVEARGVVIADWKDAYDKIKIEYDRLNEKLSENNNELHNVERDSLLKIILGMAIAKYGYDVAANQNTATGGNAGSISSDLDLHGLSLEPDTVRKYIKEAAAKFGNSY